METTGELGACQIRHPLASLRSRPAQAIQRFSCMYEARWRIRETTTSPCTCCSIPGASVRTFGCKTLKKGLVRSQWGLLFTGQVSVLKPKRPKGLRA